MPELQVLRERLDNVGAELGVQLRLRELVCHAKHGVNNVTLRPCDRGFVRIDLAEGVVNVMTHDSRIVAYLI